MERTPFGTRAYARVIVSPEQEDAEVLFYPSRLPVRCRGEWHGMKIVTLPLVPHREPVWNESGELAGYASFLGGERVFKSYEPLVWRRDNTCLVTLPCYIPDDAIQFVGDGDCIAGELWFPEPQRQFARTDSEFRMMLAAFRAIRRGEYRSEYAFVRVPHAVRQTLTELGVTVTELFVTLPPEILADALRDAWERYQRKYELALELLGGPE